MYWQGGRFARPAPGPPAAGFFLTVALIEWAGWHDGPREGAAGGGARAVAPSERSTASEEMTMSTTGGRDAQRTAAAAAKEMRERDAAAAMRDYEAERLAVLSRTARLRAERLAKEADATPAPKKQRRQTKRNG
jgi:hypothetical protein